MGTFHHDKGPLHGITVFAASGDTVYVGRCDVLNDQELVLHDADLHVEGQSGQTNSEYLQKTARFGVWKKHDQLVVKATELGQVRPLSELVRSGTNPSVSVAKSAPIIEVAAAPLAAAVDAPVTLTDGATAEVQRLLAAEAEAETEPGRGLRLGVSGGGCSGLVYKVDFDRRREGDVVVPCDGFDVYLDRKSTIYLRGVTIDHQKGLTGRGFQFINPNASNTCGCGESFAV